MTNTNLLLILLLYCLMLSTFSSCTIQCTADSWQCVGKRQRRDVFTPNLSLISLHHTSPLSSWQEKNSCLFCNIFLIYLKSQCFCFVTYFYTHVLRFIIKDFNLCYFCCVSLLIKKKLMFCGYFENWLLSKYKNSNGFRLKNSDVSGSYQKVNWLNPLFYKYKFRTYRIHFYN